MLFQRARGPVLPGTSLLDPLLSQGHISPIRPIGLTKGNYPVSSGGSPRSLAPVCLLEGSPEVSCQHLQREQDSCFRL
ncbi:unnamed protein product [Rangifer tarandus platyrhynchus]|uniref:Uncharacterized protein n=1 Tax=Rangifer tarandus platyrhynchus TaxID=3082113 RepID=A0AC59YE91_RANTA